MTADLSAKEQAVWLLQKFAPEVGVVNVPMAYRVPGHLRWWPLREALDRLVRRHPALRSLFPEVDGLPARTVLDPGDQRAVIGLETKAVTAATLPSVLSEFALRPFDVTAEVPIRALHAIGDDGDVVCLVAHHLAADSASGNIILRELVEIYERLADGEEPLPEQVGEVPTYTEPTATEDDLRFWRQALAGAGGGRLDLGRGDVPRRSFSGGMAVRHLSAAAVAGAGRLAAELSVTRNIVLLATYALLLARHGAGQRLVVGVPVDARDPDHRTVVGYHVNILAVPCRVAPDTPFRDLVRAVRDGFLAGLAHIRASVDEVFPGSYESIGAQREPLFRHLFNYRAVELGGWSQRHGLALIEVPKPVSRLEVELTVRDRESEIALHAAYSDELYPDGAVEALLDRFDTLLRAAAEDSGRMVSELPLWTDEDRAVVEKARADAALAAVTGGTDGAVLLDGYRRPLPPGPLGELHVPAPDGGYRATGVLARWSWDGTFALDGAERPAPEPPGEPARGADPVLLDFLVEQWRSLLGEPGLDAAAHFFRHGGTSLKAAQLVARVRARCGVGLSLREVFRAPTPESLARHLAGTAR